MSLDFLEILEFAKKIEVHNEKWIILKTLPQGMAMAVKDGTVPPCPIYLIQVEWPKLPNPSGGD